MAREVAVIPPPQGPTREVEKIKDVLGPGDGRPESGYSIKEELDDLRRIVGELRAENVALHEKFDALVARTEGHTHTDLETWIQKVRSDLQVEGQNMASQLDAHFHPEIVDIENALGLERRTRGNEIAVPPDDQEQ